MRVDERAAVHAALGDPKRLEIVDLLRLSDRTPSELAASLGVGSNLLAHHLAVLEQVGAIRRVVSEGDRRRRYVAMDHRVIEGIDPLRRDRPHSVLIVCSRNSARSQLAEALWGQRWGGVVGSAGPLPAPCVHPKAVAVAAEIGIDLSTNRPRGYHEIELVPDLLISVCDRAREAALPRAAQHLHWSVPDPVEMGTLAAFRHARDEIAARISHLGSVFEEDDHDN